MSTSPERPDLAVTPDPLARRDPAGLVVLVLTLAAAVPAAVLVLPNTAT
jgi:uncharacterized RDD family membrane protein YckC